MNIVQFAEQHSFGIRRAGGEQICVGWKLSKQAPNRPEYHCHIFDNHDGRLGVYLGFDTSLEWTTAKTALLRKGLTLKQDATTDGTLLFNPADPGPFGGFSTTKIGPFAVPPRGPGKSLPSHGPWKNMWWEWTGDTLQTLVHDFIWRKGENLDVSN